MYETNVDRSNFADKSQAALKREEHAKRLFDTEKTRIECLAVDKTTETLLHPADHLTQACWMDFSRYVKSHRG